MYARSLCKIPDKTYLRNILTFMKQPLASSQLQIDTQRKKRKTIIEPALEEAVTETRQAWRENGGRAAGMQSVRYRICPCLLYSVHYTPDLDIHMDLMAVFNVTTVHIYVQSWWGYDF